MSEKKARLPFTQAIVVGGTGQTGGRLLEVFREGGVSRIVATARSSEKTHGSAQWFPVDLESDEAVVQAQLAKAAGALRPDEPTALVFAAAFTNVEGCEADPAFCERVNETNTITVFRWARENFRARFAFYSSDYVFDGASGPYVETAPRNALNVYGRSKAKLEEWCEANMPDGLIVRTTGVYDDLAGSKNFFMQMLELWGAGKTARIPADQWSNPVWALELARATVELLARGERGLFHVAGATQLPRDEFARTIARVFSFDPKLVTPVLTAELGQKARRPLRGGLVCDKLRATLGWAPGGALDTLEHLKALRSSKE